MTAFEGEKLLTIALDRASGKERWRRESPRDRREKLDRRNGPASPTPVADGKNVYVFFPDYGLLSYTFAGEERWRTPLGPFNNVYGMGASPVLAGDLVVLVCDQNRGSFAAGFRQADGREVWRTRAAGRAQRPLDAHRLRPARRAAAGGGARLLPHGQLLGGHRRDRLLGERPARGDEVGPRPGRRHHLRQRLLDARQRPRPAGDRARPSPRSWPSRTRTRTARSPRPRRPTSGRAGTSSSSISTRTAPPMRPNGGSGSTAPPPRMASWPFAPEAAAT